MYSTTLRTVCAVLTVTKGHAVRISATFQEPRIVPASQAHYLSGVFLNLAFKLGPRFAF